MASTPFINPNVAQRHSDVEVLGTYTSDGALVGLLPTTPVGFYGSNPVTIQSISLGSGTLAQLITALGNMGLINVTA